MISKTLSAATTKAIILGILKQRKSYGYLILKNIKEISGGRIEWSDGMLYPVLHRLENDGFIHPQCSVNSLDGDLKNGRYLTVGADLLLQLRKQGKALSFLLEFMSQAGNRDIKLHVRSGQFIHLPFVVLDLAA